MNRHIADLETALIFLREGLVRTKNLQALIEIGKAESPDIPCRIEKIEGTIRRFENEISDYRTDILNAEKEKKEEAERELREVKKALRAAERAERKAAEEAERKAVKEAEEKEAEDEHYTRSL